MTITGIDNPDLVTGFDNKAHMEHAGLPATGISQSLDDGAL